MAWDTEPPGKWLAALGEWEMPGYPGLPGRTWPTELDCPRFTVMMNFREVEKFAHAPTREPGSHARHASTTAQTLWCAPNCQDWALKGEFGARDGGGVSPCLHRVACPCLAGRAGEEGAVCPLSPHCTHPGWQLSGWGIWDLSGSL